MRNFIGKNNIIPTTGIAGGRIIFRAPKTWRIAEFYKGQVRKVAR